MQSKQQFLQVDGRRIPVSNLSKVLYPKTRFTKGQVIDYYIQISQAMLPHLRDRPVTVKRYPDGVLGKFFYEKNAPAHTPDWVKRHPVPSPTRGADIHYVLVNDLPTLVWLANAAALELHPFLHRASRLDQPTFIVFDLDPGEGADILSCCQVALRLRALLSEMNLQCYPKVSGSKGLQISVPLNTAVSYEQTKPFAQAIAQQLEESNPDRIVSRMSKQLRSGKVFIDWSQNDQHKTTAGVYSLRASREQPFVSTPLEWEELERALKAMDSRRLYFDPANVLKRVGERGDLYSAVLTQKQRLPKDWTAAIAEASARALRLPKRSSARSAQAPGLETYRTKRDFSQTREPAPAASHIVQGNGARHFVVQKHEASHLHYDFRLEMDNVLKSWAVPKGPPYEKAERRLAVATEDHPREYLDFEGTIPKGQYGGGTVMVWDLGTYDLLKGTYAKGTMRLRLEGRKLQGEWILTRSRANGGKNWFLIKGGKSMAPISSKLDDQSAITGRRMREIQTAPGAVWRSRPKTAVAGRSGALRVASKGRKRTSKSESDGTPETAHADTAGGEEANFESSPRSPLKFVPVMLARSVQEVPKGEDWSYEIKLDGYRALAIQAHGETALFSRRGNRLHRFPAIIEAVASLPEGIMLDGEIVAMDADGKPSFNALQNHSRKSPLYFYVFDLLSYEGRDIRSMPLSARRALLEKLIVNKLADPIRFSPSFSVPPAKLLRSVREQGLEGIVAKRSASAYESGRRSGAWQKYKIQSSEEMVIGGYTMGPHVFDALLVGQYQGSRLMFVAKVRNGFVPSLRRAVAARFQGFETAQCPFANLPEPAHARRGNALTKTAMRACRWLRPKMVVQVKFAEWTPAASLREAAFAGLRDDKLARDVTHTPSVLASDFLHL